MSPMNALIETRPGRAAGRPRNTASPCRRAEQVRLVSLYLKGDLLAKQGAGAAGITIRQFFRWCSELLAEDGPTGATLRAVARKNRRRLAIPDDPN